MTGSTPYTFVFDLAPGDYEFTIYDQFGDGICCSYGAGGYDLSIGGDQIASSAWGGATGTGDGGDGTNGFVGLVSETVQFHVPEPATLSLFGLGLIAVGILGRRRGWKTRIERPVSVCHYRKAPPPGPFCFFNAVSRGWR